jgi:hypothetical protein
LKSFLVGQLMKSLSVELATWVGLIRFRNIAVNYTSDEFESFWARHQKLLSDITSLRDTYKPEERTYLHGFTDRDYDEDDDDKSWNLDCVFMMRVCSTISSVTDVEKFLGRTKRDYLPIIIKAFMTTPKTDFFAPNPWWQFWKRGKG